MTLFIIITDLVEYVKQYSIVFRDLISEIYASVAMATRRVEEGRQGEDALARCSDARPDLQQLQLPFHGGGKHEARVRELVPSIQS